MTCEQRRDLILLYAAGSLEPAEAGELRAHLAAGCPRCIGSLAEAEAALSMVALALPAAEPPSDLKHKVLRRCCGETAAPNEQAPSPAPPPMRSTSWDRIVLPSAIAAVVAVAITLFVVRQVTPQNNSAEYIKTIEALKGQLMIEQAQLEGFRHSFEGMKFTELTGSAQPAAEGHAFIDEKMHNWYFFTCGMKPAPDGKTYELWMIQNGQKIPAGTFQVSPQGGAAALLGPLPALSSTNVTLAVTDEPIEGSHKVPLGSVQLKGTVE